MQNKLQTYYFYDDESSMLAYATDEETICIMTADTPCTQCLKCEAI